MSLVQNILIFYQTSPGLDIPPTAWALYEASKGSEVNDIIEEEYPPYSNAMEAMRDGWEIIQISENKSYSKSEAYEVGPIPYQTVLSKFTELIPG